MIFDNFVFLLLYWQPLLNTRDRDKSDYSFSPLTEIFFFSELAWMFLNFKTIKSCLWSSVFNILNKYI